ncbi:hypothetical protein NM688_g2342 [Phlebia brevispora]|uniref:Uncharacterized protein n=1 Tax=Phlebia brevispora TaxID=194682 RepID=A0ACC1T940_9APHY|nr:hypothetical protein NM688_g2342 [Phlebia brevispora]
MQSQPSPGRQSISIKCNEVELLYRRTLRSQHPNDTVITVSHVFDLYADHLDFKHCWRVVKNSICEHWYVPSSHLCLVLWLTIVLYTSRCPFKRANLLEEAVCKPLRYDCADLNDCEINKQRPHDWHGGALMVFGNATPNDSPGNLHLRQRCWTVKHTVPSSSRDAVRTSVLVREVITGLRKSIQLEVKDVYSGGALERLIQQDMPKDKPISLQQYLTGNIQKISLAIIARIQRYHPIEQVPEPLQYFQPPPPVDEGLGVDSCLTMDDLRRKYPKYLAYLDE